MKEFRNTGYFVTEEGNVIGKKKQLKKTITPYGYESVCSYFDGKYKTFLVHRMVAEIYISNPYKKSDVNHIDGDKLNNQSTNLEWVTKKENVNHFLNMANRKIGEHPNSKLSFQDMQNIYDCFVTNNIYKSELAKKYNVDRTTISRAINIIKKIQNQPKEIR